MIPTNIADAAAQIRDGEFGLIEQVKIGDLIVSALTAIDGEDAYSITRKPVQAGYTVTDAAVALPRDRVIEICLANPDYSVTGLTEAALTGSVTALAETWRDKKKRLYEIMETREIITFQTHEEVLPGRLVQSIVPHEDVNDNWDAFFATVTIVELMGYNAESNAGAFDQSQQDLGNLNQ